MARSVNSVASRKRRKKFLKKLRDILEEEKNVYTVAKNAVEKVFHMPTEIEKIKKEVLDHCGFLE